MLQTETDTRMSIQMDQLPVDLHIEILSRLPIKCLVRCRCVCKSWLVLIRDPRFTQGHLPRSSLTGPSLILNDTSYSNGGKIYFAEHDQTHDYTYASVHLSAPPDFKEFRVVGSCNGLLCLVHRKYRYMICVFNPFTGEYVELLDWASSLHLHFEAVIGFAFSSKTNEYKIVVVIPVWEGIQHCGFSEVFCYTLGDESWRDMEDFPCVLMQRSPDSNASVIHGVLHWTCVFPVDLLVSFDIADEVFGVIPHPEFGNGYELSCWSLGVLRGCLSIMDSSFDDRVEIWVMEDYGVEKSWTKCLSINIIQVDWNIRFCQTLCFGRDGKLLCLFNNEELLLYDPQTVRIRRLRIDGLPSCFEAITHLGILVPLSDCLRRTRQM